MGIPLVTPEETLRLLALEESLDRGETKYANKPIPLEEALGAVVEGIRKGWVDGFCVSPAPPELRAGGSEVAWHIHVTEQGKRAVAAWEKRNANA